MPRTVLRDDPEASIERSPDGYSMLAFSCPVDGCYVCIAITWGDVAAAEKARGRGPVWKASGEFPDTLTLEPSVHIQTSENGKRVSHWHGWLRDGVAE